MDRRLARLTLIEWVRLHLGSVVIGTVLWRRMCELGCCPQGIHERWQDLYARGAPAGTTMYPRSEHVTPSEQEV